MDKRQSDSIRNVLIVTSVEAEKEAIMQGIDQNDTNLTVVVSGVGIAASAATTAMEISINNYDLVLNLGIGGAFPGKAEIASIVVSSDVIAADLGAETDEGFVPIEKLGFGASTVHVDKSLVDKVVTTINKMDIPVYTGPILSVSTVTGTMEQAHLLEERVPGAIVEAMEGYGVAIAAQKMNVPMLEIRSISNMVGPRDRDAWRIKEALQSLTVISSKLQEVLT
ncbi:futalosine hydrolase [Bacillus sp. FJAT-45350]|uniref:futalosine hydrolase n=1 Tax=Bacillus sp. FJAT-45350 TaxID=2011014 RepID=UPI0015CA8F97|nr:futalosine hydrolase [Bacillus sp. FJAT-45350]